MNLTADQFQDIISTLRSDSGSPRNAEKRASPRVGLRARICISPMFEGGLPRWITAWVRDLSSDGMGLTQNEPLHAGTRFLVRFPRRGLRPLEVIYVVAHCRALAKQIFSVGARLERVVEDTSVLAHYPPPKQFQSHN